MKRTLLTICAAITTLCAVAQTPVVVEPQSQRTQTAQTTTDSYTTRSYSPGRYSSTYTDRANRWAVGLNFNAATNNPVWEFGLGANLQFYATDAFRIEASYNGLLRRHYWASWNVNLNLHYLIEVADNLELYPLVGVAFNHAQFKVDAEDAWDDTAYSHKFGAIGLNVGGGIQYSINEHLFVKAEAYWKYAPEKLLDPEERAAARTKTHFGSRTVLIAGIGYCF